jgi:hypothetical protein
MNCKRRIPMRHRSHVVALLLLLACAAPGWGQVSLGVAGGPSSPVGGLGDVVNPGLHAGLVVDLGLPLIPIALRGEVMYQRLPGVGANPAFNQVWAAANGRLDLLPLPLLGLYVTGGPGIYSSSFSTVPGGDSTRSNDVGINLGVGADVNLFMVRPFVELRYHRVLTDPARAFVPLTVGVFF